MMTPILRFAAAAWLFVGCATSDPLDPGFEPSETTGGTHATDGGGSAGTTPTPGGAGGSASAGHAGASGSAGSAASAGDGDSAGTSDGGTSSGGTSFGGSSFGGSGGSSFGGSGGTGSLPSKTPCGSDADCSGSPYGEVCDTAAGECVECLPGNEAACAPDGHCDATTKTCEWGCDDDADCQGSGLCTARTCEVSLGQCVGCCG